MILFAEEGKINIKIYTVCQQLAIDGGARERRFSCLPSGDFVQIYETRTNFWYSESNVAAVSGRMNANGLLH